MVLRLSEGLGLAAEQLGGIFDRFLWAGSARFFEFGLPPRCESNGDESEEERDALKAAALRRAGLPNRLVDLSGRLREHS